MSQLKIASALLLAVGLLAGHPQSTLAQTRPKSGAEKRPATQTNAPASSVKQPVAGPFHGKLRAVDKTARTISVGKRTFQITPETKLRKAGQPATLEDAVVGENCSGYVKPTADGKWLATTVNLGPKPEKQGSARKQ